MQDKVWKNSLKGLMLAGVLGAGTLYAPVVSGTDVSARKNVVGADSAIPAFVPDEVKPSTRRNPDAPAEYERIYQDRFATLMKNGGVILDYDPMEPVPGATLDQPLKHARPAERTINQAALDEAASYAKASNARAFIVWRNGKIEHEAYFNGFNRDTQIVAKSLAKPMTALAVGRAIALGKIQSVDQYATDFIPEWKGTNKAGIKIRHLLDMRSGLLEQMISKDPDHPINRVYISADHGWHLVNNYPITHEPGTYYGYGNAVSELVAVIIERATGVRYGDFVGQEILQKIGARGGKIWVSSKGGLAHSGCCMTLPGESWLKLGLLVLNDGVANGTRLLPEGYVSEMVKGTEANPHYGMGVWVAGPYLERRGFGAVGKPGPKVLHSEPYLDKDLVLFDGNANQTIYISKATNMVVMRLGEFPSRDNEWDNSRLPNLLMRNIIWKKGEKRPVPQT